MPMKRIGVISDTHLTAAAGGWNGLKRRIRNKRTLEDLRLIAQQHFRNVDCIIHAGDFVDLSVCEMLQEIAPVEAVQGNMDSAEIRQILPFKKEISIEGFTIGIIHGNGAPQGIMERIRPMFNQVDVIVFGHSHHPVNRIQDGVLWFNPGSPTDRFFAPYNSIGLLEASEAIKGYIIQL